MKSRDIQGCKSIEGMVIIHTWQFYMKQEIVLFWGTCGCLFTGVIKACRYNSINLDILADDPPAGVIIIIMCFNDILFGEGKTKNCATFPLILLQIIKQFIWKSKQNL